MGSLSTPPTKLNHQIYVAFCSREFDDNTKFSNWIGRFDPDNAAWSYVTSIPGVSEDLVLKDFAMVCVEDSIFIIGGRLCCKERIVHSDSNGSEEVVEKEVRVLPTMLRYNVIIEQWSECAPLSMPRYNFACTVCEKKIYVAGGQHEVDSAKSTPKVEMYDPSLNEWTKLPDLRRLRCKCVGMTWQNKVYVVGGFVIGGCDPNLQLAYVERCSAEMYDTQRGQWDLVPGMWQLDIPPNQIVDVEGKLFSSGDCFNVWKGHIETYDAKLNMWNAIEGSQLDCNLNLRQRLYVTMAPIGPHLYFVIGYKVLGDVPSTVTQVHRFDTTAEQNCWTSFEAVQEEGDRELCSHCCVVALSS